MEQNRAGLTSEASDILPPTPTHILGCMLPQSWLTIRGERQREARDTDREIEREKSKIKNEEERTRAKERRLVQGREDRRRKR